MVITPGLKKGFGIFLVVLFTILELLFLAVLIYNLFTGGEDSIQNILSFLFVMGLVFFPLWWGLSLWKSASIPSKPNSQDLVSLPPNEAIKIDVKISLAEYRKLSFRLAYMTPAFVFLNFIGILMIATYLSTDTGDWFILFIALFLLYLPIGIYIHTSSNYKTTKFLNEAVTYEFTPETISAAGASFQSTIQWSVLYKVRELTDWFLLYTSKQQAMFIPKGAFHSMEELESFRRMWRAKVA
jgi:hypothetical protein